MTSEFLTPVTPAEMQLLSAAVIAFDVDESDGDALHLRVHDGAREWIVENDNGQLFVWVDDPENVAVPGQFALSDRLRRFADAFDDGPLEVFLVDGTTSLVKAARATAAIDLVPAPANEVTVWPVHETATAWVSMREFLMILWSARCMPTGIVETGYPMPPMWMEIAAGGVGLHVDWTDFLPCRATYRIAASSQRGEATVAIPHAVIENFLRTTPLTDDDGEDLTLSVTIGTSTVHDTVQHVVRFTGSNWSLVVRQFDPLGGRWRAAVDELLSDAGIPVKERSADEWLVRWHDHEVRVKLHPGHPDVARVSAPLLTHTLESMELLRELGQLNAASNGLRYWLQDEVVWVAADVKCTTLSSLPAAVRDVADAALTYSPMLAAFATT